MNCNNIILCQNIDKEDLKMNHTIAIIGAGPAGYTLAQELVKQGGYDIDIFDKESSIGGAIYTGIPEYRMPKSFLNKAYEGLIEAGVKFHFDAEINTEKFEELKQKYDRVIVAIGAQVENTFGFDTGNGLFAGLTLLYDLNINKNHEDYKKYHHAIVWGGGNVAMDCARSLIRIIDKVTVVYRRSEDEMPANKNEIRDARKEGVAFNFLENIKEILRDENGQVVGAKVAKMELGEPDESGRRSTHEVANSTYEEKADLIVMAIGQKVNFKVLHEDLMSTEGYLSNQENVYIIGDAKTGPATIGSAVLEGKAVAKEIIQSFE